jgi:hypothetical protein
MPLTAEEIQGKLDDFISTITVIDYTEVKEFHEANAYSSLDPDVVTIVNKLDEINKNSVTNLLIKEPKTILVFEKLLRETRFSNAQLSYFCFNLIDINKGDISISASIFDKHFQNNQLFREKVMRLSKILGKVKINDLAKVTDKQKSMILRILIFNLSENSNYLVSLLKSSKFTTETADRVSDYMIINLRLEEIIKGLNVTNHLISKRAFCDTKGMHGNWGKNRVISVLERLGIPRGQDNDLKISYLDEQYVEGVMRPKRKDKRKKLDVVIYNNGKPKYAIEINYYTTYGTKIGINVGEYLDILNSVNLKDGNLEFIWITDGTGWLGSSGIDLLQNTLIPGFENSFMNINQFEKWILRIS